FRYVSGWPGPSRYSWVINGSLQPHDPDLARIVPAFADKKIAAAIAEAGADDPWTFLSHFVMGDADARAFAGAGPIVTDDQTILDFAVPRSIDAWFGFANFNTNNWLTSLMMPDAPRDAPTRLFCTKIGQLWKWQRPVLPHVRHAEVVDGGADAVARHLEAAAQGRSVRRIGQTPNGGS